MSSNPQQLQQAYHLIKSHDFTAARPLVMSVLQVDNQNINAWWLATYVARSPAEKRAALQKVLKLKPNHAPAREMLRRLNLREADATPVVEPQKPKRSQVSIQPQYKKKPNKLVWAFRIGGLLMIWGMALLIVDNFMGGMFTKPVEDALGIEPPAKGWVAEDTGGLVIGEPQDKDEVIPITQDFKIETYGEMNLNILREGEAHLYHFSAIRGADLMIAANFSVGATSEIRALELWDSNGNVIAREQDFTDLTSQIDSSADEMFASILAVRAINITAPYTGQYTIALISRNDGPKGQYGLFVTTMDATINSDMNSYLPNGLR